MSRPNTKHSSSTLESFLWLLFSVIALSGLGLYFKYQTEIFPTITTPITIDEQGVTTKALALNKSYQIGLDPQKAHSASSYQTHGDINNYITLKAGGNKKLNQLLESGYLISSHWTVRLYEESNPQEQFYFFTSGGQFYGFAVDLPETTKLPNISKQQAIEQIDIFLTRHPLAGVNLTEYHLKDYSSTTQNNGRIDHHFTYEHQDKHIAKAKFKLAITLSGDTITNCKPFIDLPESFYQEYQQMRTYNQALSNIGNVILYIGYGLIMIGALIIGFRDNLLEWYYTTLTTGIIITMGALGIINEIPSMWFYNYNTIYSFTMTYINLIINIINNSLFEIIVLGTTFIAGDFITRKAFPEHVNFWAAFKKENQSSSEISKQIGIGYGLFCIDLGYIALFYITVLQLPGVWSPSSNLQNPDAIVDFIPFFNPIARSLHAGFWEEFLFRAVPIGASFLLAKTMKKTWLIWPLLLLQAMIFGLAHANYAQQPSYIRIIELSIIFCIYGVVYLRYGLIPCVLSHYLFDVLAMSQGLFFMQTPHIVWQQIGTILALAAPFLYHLIQRARTGHLLDSKTLPASAYNKSWQQPVATTTEIITPIPTQPISTSIQQSIIATSVIVLGTLAYYYPELRITHIPGLTLTQQEAVSLAKEFAQNKLDPNKNWTISAIAQEVSYPYTEEYLKDILTKDNYETIQKNRELSSKLGVSSFDYILPYNTWHVTYRLFEGSDIDKNETLDMFIRSKTHPVQYSHFISEEVRLPNLNPAQATGLIENTMQKFTTPLDQYKVISTDTQTQPSKRLDQAKTYQDRILELIPGLDLRWHFEIQGNQVSSISNELNIPQKWLEQKDIKTNEINAFTSIFDILSTGIYVAVIFYCLYRASQNLFSLRSLLPVFFTLVAISVVARANYLPIFVHYLSPLKPLTNQWIGYISGNFINIFMFSSVVSILYMYVLSTQRQSTYQQHPSIIWTLGMLIGFSYTGVILLIDQYFGYEHSLNMTRELKSYVPILSYIIDLCTPYFKSTLFLIAICQIYSEAAQKTASQGFYNKLLLFVGVFTYLFTTYHFNSLVELATYSLATSIILLVLYSVVVHKNIVILWSITAGSLILNTAYTGSTQTHYPMAWAALSATIASLALLSYLLTAHMTQQQSTS